MEVENTRWNGGERRRRRDEVEGEAENLMVEVRTTNETLKVTRSPAYACRSGLQSAYVDNRWKMALLK